MRKSHLATLIASAVFSLGAQGADLLQVYQLALSNDAQFNSARLTLTAAQERLQQSKAPLLPSVQITGTNLRIQGSQFRTRSGAPSNATNSGTGADGASAVTISNSAINTSNYSLQLAQPLYRPELVEQLEQGKLALVGNETQFVLARQELIIRTAQAYFDILTAEEAVLFTKAQKEAVTEQLASAKRNFEVGTQTITDTHEAQAAFDLVVAQEFAAMNDLDVRRTALLQITGQSPEGLAALRPGARLGAPEPVFIEYWVDAAEKSNANVLVQQIALETAKREIAKSRTGHRPTVDLIASSRFDTQGPLFNLGVGPSQTTNSVGIQFNIPIFSGFGVTSRVKETIALEGKTRFDLENAKRTAAQGARQSFLGVNSGLAQIKALEAAEISSQSSLDSNKLGYQVGVRINIDVLNAQRQLFSTRRDLAKARHDAVMAGLRLKLAAGILKEDDLNGVNSLLQ
jgi:outer membrane protein